MKSACRQKKIRGESPRFDGLRVIVDASISIKIFFSKNHYKLNFLLIFMLFILKLSKKAFSIKRKKTKTNELRRGPK